MIEKPHRLRLVASADWHFRERVANEAELDLLLEAMASTTPDVVLVLGDLVGWHRPAELRIVFNALSRLRCPVGVVFGNHVDYTLRVRDREYDTSASSKRRYIHCAVSSYESA